jgi:hypothetical protein
LSNDVEDKRNLFVFEEEEKDENIFTESADV